MPDLKSVAEQARKLDEMLEKGNDADLEQALAELGRRPRGPAQDARSERRRLRRRALPAGEPRRRRSDEEDRRHRGRRARAAEGDAGAADRQQAEMERRHARRRSTTSSSSEVEKVERLKQRLAGIPSGPRRRRWPRSSSGRATAPGRCAGCSASAISPRQRRRRSARRAAWNAPPSTSTRLPRRGGRARPAPEQPNATSAPTRSARRAALAQEIADDLAKLQPRASDADDAAGSRGGARPGRAAVRDRQAHRRRRGRGGAQAGRDAGDGEGGVAS